jgi:NAD(P)-dependent dehydrogenase (short-subunit alcohol dehydrogenase family)
MVTQQGGECVPFAADVTKEETLTAAIEAAQARWGRIDILRNNVGVSIAGAARRNIALNHLFRNRRHVE